MSHESLLVEPAAAIDTDLWLPFSTLDGRGSVSSRLLPSNERLEIEKEAFFASEGVLSPDLTVRGITDEQLDVEEQALLDFKDRTKDYEGESDIARLYRTRVNEDIANVRMARASLHGEMSRFSRYNEFIYGLPNAEIARAVIDQICSDAEVKLASPSVPVRLAAEKVIGLLGDNRGDRSIIRPSDEVFQRVRQQHFEEGGFYDQVLAGVEWADMPKGEHPAKVNKAIGDAVLLHIMRNNLQSEYPIADSRTKAWGLNHKAPALERPSGYDLVYNRFLGLAIGHELASHLLERENGLRSAIQLISEGLDRTEIGNEGRALIREQVVYETFEQFEKTVRWVDIQRRHLATSLAAGVLGHPMTLSEVYQVINSVDRLRQLSLLKEGEDAQTAYNKAQSRSWGLMEPVFKGTPGHSAYYGRYAIYLEGNIACWNNPSMIMQGDKGKFDINNRTHTIPLAKYGVITELV